MLSVSSLIEFLLKLLRDEEAQAEFVADPHGVLARHGLDGLCAEDVRDVQPLLADHEAVRIRSGDDHAGPRYHGGHDDDDPVRVIKHITEHYEVKNVVVDDSDEYNFTYVDDRDTIVNVDDRDSTSIQADGDVTINDSFNQDNDVNVIEDSFNEDNDGIDNKGGTIEDSVAAGNDIDGSLNSDDDTKVEDSGNETNSQTYIDASDDDTSTLVAEDSYNEQDNEGGDYEAEEGTTMAEDTDAA